MSKGQLGATKLTEVSKPKIDTETPAQKQAAAKLALRKQLEKTLLQVRNIDELLHILKYLVENWYFQNIEFLDTKCVSQHNLGFRYTIAF